MTNQEKKEFREFWITDKGTYLSAGVEMWRDFIAKFKHESGLHVIEYSALEHYRDIATTSEQELKQTQQALTEANKRVEGLQKIIDAKNSAREKRNNLFPEIVNAEDKLDACISELTRTKAALDKAKEVYLAGVKSDMDELYKDPVNAQREFEFWTKPFLESIDAILKGE